jgi:predicted RecA/RadA family phage recombinase
MTVEARLINDSDSLLVVTPAGGYAAGEVIQLTDGRASVVAGLTAKAAGDPAALQAKGVHHLQKTAGVVCLKGGRAYWDRSAGKITPLQAFGTGDFYVGVFTADATSAATECDVDLNVAQRNLIDMMRDEFENLTVLTAGTPSLSFIGGTAKLAFSATAEAQKVDLLSKNSIPVSVPFIAEFRMANYDKGDAAALDLNVGVANATHATDADAITESCFIHMDGNALDIKAESDDGTTEVAATDTTVDAVDDTYFEVWMDARDLSDIQIYVDGVLVLPDSVFKLNAAAGPLKLLAHLEKTADDTPGDIRISQFAARTFDVE